MTQNNSLAAPLSACSAEPEQPAILLVDDELGVLLSLKRRLRRRYDVHTAQSGADALDVLSTKGPFAVVVTDFQMPGLDGVGFLRQARAAAPTATRVMLTGRTDSTTAIKAVNEGAVFRFLAKPCAEVDLLAAIDEGVAEHDRLTHHENVASHIMLSFQHEFRTPLNHIIGFAAYLEDGGAPAGTIREYARYIRESGDALMRVTDAILCLARIRDGREHADPRPIRPRSIMEAVRELHERSAEQRDIVLRFETSPPRARFALDGGLMTLAISALVSNAIKFGPSGAEVLVRFRTCETGDVLEVIDSGPGVDPERLSLIQEAFVQDDLGIARRYEGAGLGLPLARAIAELHGGGLSFRRADDNRFIAAITLPPDTAVMDAADASIAV